MSRITKWNWILCLVNVALFGVVIFNFDARPTQASRGLRISDMTYGQIDCDGDGVCTIGDDRMVYLGLESFPNVIEEALKTAKVNDDGTIDLSPHLWKVSERNKERHLKSLQR